MDLIVNSDATLSHTLEALASMYRADRYLRVRITTGKQRNPDTLAVCGRWYREIADYFGDRTPEDVHDMCAVDYGIPIRRRDDDYRALYDRVLGQFDRETLLEVVRHMDLPVTRDMDRDEMREYMDTLTREYAAQGIVLTGSHD